MAQVEADIAPSSVISAFEASLCGPKVKEDDPVVQKCIEMCVQNGMAPSDLVLKWEALCDKENHDMEEGPKVGHIQAIQQNMLQKKKKESAKNSKSGQPMGMGMKTPYNKTTLANLKENHTAQLGNKRLGGSMDLFGSPSFKTPAKRGGPDTPGSLGPPSSRARMLPQTPQSESLSAPMSEAPDSVYAAREQKLKTLSTLNEALAEAKLCATGPRPRCELHVIKGIQGGGAPFRYMFETTERKCSELKARLKTITDAIVLNHKLKEKAEEAGGEFIISPVNEAVWCCGRICCEGDVGHLNAASVVLEGANGRRVKLDLSQVSDFAMFPGQIVVVHGSNTTGECISVRAAYTDGSMAMATTPASQIALFNETETFLNGEPMSILTASGPFTTGADLAYVPLDDLLDHVREVKPDVVILCGPFVDARHKLLDPAMAGTPGGFSNGDPPDSLQVVRHVMRDKILAGLRECPGTVCVVIPSAHDLHVRSVFPQPAFEAEVYRPTPGEEDHQVELRMVSNPCTLRVNEVVIGISTADVLLGLSGNEAAHASGDRLARLARHVVHQRSFYPLFPPAEGTQLAMSHAQHLALPVTPDVLILPSQLAPFAKRAGDVLCVNPGRLCKGIAAGTFAKLSVHPVMRHIRTSARKAADGESKAAEAGGEVQPQQLSQDFESAATEEGKEEAKQEVEEGAKDESHVPASGAEQEQEATAAAEEKEQAEGEKVGQAAPPEADGDTAMTDAKSEEDAAQTAPATEEAKDSVAEHTPQQLPAAADRHEPTLHRVLDRTRVDIIRI